MTQHIKTVLLLTRPSTAAETFAARIRAFELPGLEICAAPLMQITPTHDTLDLGRARGVIFSSRNGVEMANELTQDRLPCHCVGRSTAALAAETGWAVLTCEQTADDLVGHLLTTDSDTPLVHIGGRERRGDVAARLTQAGIPTNEHVAYEQNLLPLPQPAIAALRGPAPVIAPLFSPRSARHFARTAKPSVPLWLPVISPAAAEPLESLGSGRVLVAKAPDADAMVDATLEAYREATRVEGAPRGH